MSTSLLKQILEETAVLDQKYQGISIPQLTRQTISFPVAKDHHRFKQIQSYSLTCRRLKSKDLRNSSLIFLDHQISQEPWIKTIIQKDAPVILVKAHEIEFQEIQSLADSLQYMQGIRKSHITAIGGGSLLYAIGYIAERWECDVTYIPTTPISMADTGIGGKVRIHRVKNDIYERHYYRSYYEPNQIIVDKRFIQDLPDYEVSMGVAEIVKHALYQSSGLLNYLLSPAFDPFNDKDSLLKAILWTAGLKRICLSIDPMESETGANAILRAAHHISDQLEVESKLQMRHGKAVWRAMEIDTKNNAEQAKNFAALAKKLWLK